MAVNKIIIKSSKGYDDADHQDTMDRHTCPECGHCSGNNFYSLVNGGAYEKYVCRKCYCEWKCLTKL